MLKMDVQYITTAGWIDQLQELRSDQFLNGLLLWDFIFQISQ